MDDERMALGETRGAGGGQGRVEAVCGKVEGRHGGVVGSVDVEGALSKHQRPRLPPPRPPAEEPARRAVRHFLHGGQEVGRQLGLAHVLGDMLQ